MNIFTEITIVRAQHALVDAVLHYLIDGDIPFMIQGGRYNNLSITISVMDRVDSMQLIRHAGRACGSDIDPPIQIHLGLVQAPDVVAGLSVPQGTGQSTSFPIPKELWTYHSVHTKHLEQIIDGDIGAELDPAPASWHAAQIRLKAGEVLGSLVMLKSRVKQEQSTFEPTCLVKVRDASEWFLLHNLARQEDSQVHIEGFFALPADGLTWTTTEKLAEIEGLNPDNVLDHDPNDPPATGAE
jgi:hypothetical protein